MYIPDQINQALEEIEGEMSNEQKKVITELTYNELYKIHFGMGTWIRNRFLQKQGELYKYFISMDVKSADSMSSVLIMYIYFYLKSKRRKA